MTQEERKGGGNRHAKHDMICKDTQEMKAYETRTVARTRDAMIMRRQHGKKSDMKEGKERRINTVEKANMTKKGGNVKIYETRKGTRTRG